MASLYVKKLGMINPFVVASSPATQGARNLLKMAKCRPGALVLRNYGHGAGGGSFVSPSVSDMLAGKQAFHSHAVGTQMRDPIDTFEKYCGEVRAIRRQLDSDIKLWVSVGHYSDIVRGGDWEQNWVNQAKELKSLGADAVELHFNTPGIAVARDRIFDYYQLLYHVVRRIKQDVPGLPVMAKLTCEASDPLTAMRVASSAGADAVGPTARWKGFYFDLDWRTTQARPGSGYGGTQTTPIVCYSVAEARTAGVTTPMYAGGGVFSYGQALRIVMAGSDCVQLGAIACSGGVGAAARLIQGFERWMDQNGYPDMDCLCGDALKLFQMPGEVAAERTEALGTAYRRGQVERRICIGCGRCTDVCWHDGIVLREGKAQKTDRCIGCGYCFGACPTHALHVDVPGILSSVLKKHKI